MKKILILANSDIGLYKFRRELIEVLLRKYKIFISLPKGQFVQDFIDMGCGFIQTEFERRSMNPINELKLLYTYKRIITELNPDMILSYTIKPNLYGGLIVSTKKIPYIVNITGLGSAVEKNILLQKFIVAFYKVSLRNVKTVFFQNLENQKYFEKHKIALGKHVLIPGSGVNLDYYQAADYPDLNVIKFVFVARIMREKGIDQYLEMAEAIREKHSDVEFHICGFCEQDYEKKLEEYSEKGIVKYHGMVCDMRDIYRRVHCVVHPTYYPEGLSNVLLEALATARPVITTDRPGCREAVENGVNGFLVKEKNTEDLINKVEQFIALPRAQKKEMGLAGRKKAEKEFDRNIVIREYLKAIKKL